MKALPPSLAVCLSAGLAAALPCQTVHQVGVFGFSTINAAIAAASPGDIVLVDPGTHAPFVLDKALTIRGTPGLSTNVITFGSVRSAVNLPAGQTAHFTHLQFGGLAVGSGQVTFDSCSFVGAQPQLRIANSVVHLQSCTVQSNGAIALADASLSLQQASMFASGCTILGADGSPFSAPAPAISMTASQLFASNLTVRAGSGSSAVPVPAVVADAQSHLQLADSTLSTTLAPCPIVGGNGRIDRCVLTPACSPLPALPVLGATRLGSQPPRLGMPFGAEFHAGPGDLVVTWAAFELSPTAHPLLSSPLLVPAGTAFPAGWFVANASGVATGLWQIPQDPALVHREVWIQGLSGLSLPVRASVAVGGLVR